VLAAVDEPAGGRWILTLLLLATVVKAQLEGLEESQQIGVIGVHQRAADVVDDAGLD
jgi:hypothetical protein